MKILQIGKYYPPYFGGIETVTQLLAEGLNDAGVSCDVLCANSTRQSTVDDHKGYRIIRMGSFGAKFSTPMSPGLILWLYNNCDDYNVIHLHLPNPLAELAILIVRPKAKLILHWHSDVDPEKFGVLAKLHAPLTRWIIQRASKIIGATKAHIECSNYREIMMGKSSIIPYPFRRPDATILSESKRLYKNNYEGRFVVLAVGRLIYYKGFQYLIEAAKHLPSKCLVVIVGAGPMYGELQTKIDFNGLSDRVILKGGLKESELLHYFSLCDLFCFPSSSRGEMFGMAQLEAMAFKKPVIGTRIPYSGVCEVNLHNITGLTVPVGNPVAIADAILRLMNDPSYRHALGRAGYKQIEEVYDMSVVIPQFINLYSDCLVV